MPKTNKHGFSYLGRDKNGYFLRRYHGGKLYRLPDMESPDFLIAYSKALLTSENEIETEVRHTKDSQKINWLISQFMQSSAFQNLAPNTIKSYTSKLHKINKAFGKQRFKNINTIDLYNFRELNSGNPAASNMTLCAFRAMCRWAKSAGYINFDSSAGIDLINYKKVPHPAWTKSTQMTFEYYYRVGTRERLAYEILRETGARCCDALRLSWDNIDQRNGQTYLHYVCQKTKVHAALSISERMTDLIQDIPKNKPFIQLKNGRDFSNPNYFSRWFSQVASRAKLHEYTAHGLRKTACIDRLEAKLTVAQVMAQLGWKNPEQAMRYAEEMDWQKLGENALHNQF